MPRSVLFVSGVESAPFRYRVTNLLEQLAVLQVPATVRHFHDEEAIRLVSEHEVVIFQRVPWDDYVARLIGQAKRAGALPVFGIDDLLFDPSRPPPHLSSVAREEAEAWMNLVRSYRRVFDACDAFLGSTETLARSAAALGKKAFVHRNSLSRELIELSNAARLRKRSPGEVRIGYFSGTRTHARDFALVSGVLERVLRARPQTRLLLVGEVPVPRTMERFGARVERRPVAPWRQLPGLIAQADVNLAPLELDERFCHAKSELKWFEAAVVSVPTIASPTEPYRFAIREGETGFLAGPPQEWEEKLFRLVDDAPLRERVAHAACEEALARYGPEASARVLESSLRGMNALRRQSDLHEVKPVTHAEIAALKAAGFGIGKAALEPGDAIAGPEQLATRLPTPALNGEISATQTFRCPPGLLYRIDVLVGSHRRINSHDVELRLLDAQARSPLAQATADAAGACDNAWFAFEFEKSVYIEEARDLSFVVEAPMAPPGQGLSIWYEPSPAGNGACADLEPLDLVYRTWFRPAGWRAPPAPRDPFDLDTADSARLLALLRKERDARRTLEKRLERAEDRTAATQLEIAGVRQHLLALGDSILLFGKLRGTLPFKVARWIYRWFRR